MTKCSVYHILVGKAVAGFERTDSNSERNSIVHKILSKALQMVTAVRKLKDTYALVGKL